MLNHRRAPSWMVVALVAVGASRSGMAAPGDLDPTFGRNGTLKTFLGGGSVARALLRQSDGKLVAAGYGSLQGKRAVAVLRYRGDGSLDSGFGTGGIVFQQLAEGGSEAKAAVLQPDGKIVIAGVATDAAGQTAVLLARYTMDGHLDASFGNGGKSFGAFGHDGAAALVRRQDGRLIVAGPPDLPGAAGFMLNGFTPDGAQARFVAAQSVPIGGGEVVANALALQPDGRIVVSGSAANGGSFGSDRDLATVRYEADGTADATFGTGGVVLTDVQGFEDIGAAVLVQPDGKIVVAGTGEDENGDTAFALIRYTDDGELDSGFGNAGKVVTPRAESATGTAVLQSDGKIVVGGSDYDFGVLRYDGSGALDDGFGRHGIVTTSVGDGGGGDTIYGLLIQPDGDIVAAGFASHNSGADFELVRYLGGPAVCGNGITEPGEQCDDHNTVDGDCCSSSCQREERLACHVGDLIVADAGAFDRGAIFRVEAGNGRQTRLASGGIFTVLGQMAVDGTGGLLVPTAGPFFLDSPAILRLDPATGEQDVVTSAGALQGPQAVVLQDRGQILVTDLSLFASDESALVRVDGVTGGQTIVSQGGKLVAPAGLVRAPDGGAYVADRGDDVTPAALLHVSTTNGEQVIVSLGGNLRRPIGMVLAPDGALLVADADAAGGSGAIVRIDPTTGVQQTVASGGSFVDPTGLAVAGDGQIFVADPSAAGGGGAIIRVDPASGAQSIVSSGQSFVDPVSVVVITSTTTTSTMPPPSELCGNGHLDPGEQCDDGNRLNNDCCSYPACAAARRGTPCGNGHSEECDGADACDSDGNCVDNHVAAGTPCGDDGLVCTDDRCNGDGQCLHTPGNPGAECRVAGSRGACDGGDVCDGVSAECPEGGVDQGCFATVPDSVGGKTIPVTCDAQAETVQGGRSTCVAAGFQDATTSPAAEPSATDVEPLACQGRQLTKRVTLRLKRDAEFREASFKVQLNPFGKRLLRKVGSLRVCLEVTIKHGTQSAVHRYIVEVVR